ncbi:MAG TPA: class I SAM-dependent methyltransferase [Pyrinomonadaceae bacterium]|jgi:2-polyprenyl-3-methyl-5-hydroxy-6-metoxy-1,4-benzoquinol methylase|nr:class I SAM-dependent methyltransferase [Pyrinomonadaceae bacterium]
MTPDKAPPNPQLFWQVMTGFQMSAAMKTAVELALFTKIAEGNKTATAIAQACDASKRGIRILCDTMAVLGFLSKEGNEYGLTEVSGAFLDKNSPMYIGSTIEFLMSPMQMRGYEDLTTAVKQGGSSRREDDSIAEDSEMWVKFAQAMAPMMFPSAQFMAETLVAAPERKFKVLDVAAGHGIFGVLLAQKYTNAEIYALDWANVLTVAQANAKRYEVGDRYHTIPGSAFDVDMGEGYDIVLLTNFLHHFDKPTCIEFLKKIRAALADDGQVLTLEFIPNDDRISPPAEALFSLVMLAATPGGDAYTFAELKEMFEAAGFSQNEHRPIPQMPQHWIVSKK